MDYVVVGIVAFLAVLYLFRRFWNTVKRKNVSCGCGGCDGACGKPLPNCAGSCAAKSGHNH